MHPVLEHKNFIQQVYVVVVAMEYIQVFKELTKNMVRGCACIKMTPYQKMPLNWN